MRTPDNNDIFKAEHIKDIPNDRLVKLVLACLDGVDNPYNWRSIELEISRRIIVATTKGHNDPKDVA